RFEPDRTATVMSSMNEPTFAAGSRWALDGPSVSAAVLETERPARVDDYARLPGTVAAAVRDSTMRSTVGVPIAVDGRVWGVMVVGSDGTAPLAADTEARLRGFADLLATAISNAESRKRVDQLADEQAALRRVATLVAEDAASDQLYAAV